MSGIRAQRKAERPKEILEAAFEEFVQNGYAATRLEDVAARAGVTKGTIYFYFESKERVFEAVVNAFHRAPMLEFQEADGAWTGDLATDIDGFLTRMYRFCTEDPRSREILRLLIAEAHRFPALVDLHFEEFMRPVVARLRERLVDAVAAGDIGPDATAGLAEVVLAPVLALNVMMLLFANRIPLDPNVFMATHRAVLLAGLLPRGDDRDGKQTPHALANAEEHTRGWTEWCRFPDPRRREALTAPLGPGLYELRLQTGESVLFGTGHSVVGRMTTLLPPEIAPEQRKTSSRRRYLSTNLEALQYRTCATQTYAEAVAVAAAMTERSYRFGRLP